MLMSASFLRARIKSNRHVGCKILIELQCPIPQWGCPTEHISSGKAWVNKHFLEGKQEKPTVFAKVIIPGLPTPMEISQMQEFQICLWYSELLGCTSYEATVQVAPLHSYLHPGAQALAYVPWQLQHRGCVTYPGSHTDVKLRQGHSGKWEML